jgi:hypothetical protein
MTGYVSREVDEEFSRHWALWVRWYAWRNYALSLGYQDWDARIWAGRMMGRWFL